MYKDMPPTKSRKIHRIICEDFNISHPCEAIAVVFDISNPIQPKEVYRASAPIGTTLDTLMYKAQKYAETSP
jgi:hypothetical protein